MIYEYWINLDERGELFADVRGDDGETVFEIHGFDIFEDGFMRNKSDVRGLEAHLKSLGVMRKRDQLIAFRS